MAAESAFNRAAMAQAAVQVEDTVNQVRMLQTQLAAQHADLMGGWQGQAAAAFTSAYEAFNSDFTRVLQALQDIHDKLTTTQTRYTAAEEAQAAAANMVRSLLNG